MDDVLTAQMAARADDAGITFVAFTATPKTKSMVSNTKEQFANSPDLMTELVSAIMSALDAHTAMAEQALDSEPIRVRLRDVLLGPGRLYEALRELAGGGRGTP